METPWESFCATHRLTKSEGRNAALICKGQDNFEVAASLGISYNYAKNVNGRLFKKVGVNTRLRFVVYARSWVSDFIRRQKAGGNYELPQAYRGAAGAAPATRPANPEAH